MKYFVLFLTTLLSGTLLYGQNPTIITLSSPDSGNKNYVAQTKVQMNPGYKYTGGANSMRAYIEQAMSYSPLFSSSTFDGATINTGYPVGAINGEAGVSGTGAMNYSVPIMLPSGTNGLIPSLSIAYNSQGENDILGVGWSLNGFSEITVVPTTWYQDGTVETVKLDGTDKFALDGNRLHAVSGTYGANGSVYSTENESYYKITAFGGSTGPDWFKVETKDGKTMEFGNSSDSKIKAQNTNAFISWKLNKIYDTYGNYVQFVYRNENNDCRIDKIYFTGNSTQNIAPYNRVEFEYKTRNDINTRYIVGKSFNMNTLLSKIKIFSEGEIFKSYEFTYGENHYSYLSSVTEFGSDGTSLNPTIFKYGDKNPDIEIVPSTSFTPPVGAVTMNSGDYNGDGKTDFLVKYASSWEVLVSDGLGGFSHYASGGLPSGYVLYFDSKIRDQKINGLCNSFDFFGDGQDDVILTKYNVTYDDDDNPLYSDLQIIIQDIDGLDDVSNSYTPPINSGGYFMPSKFLNIGDYDGDGRDDILYIKYPSPTNYLASAELITVSGGVETVYLSSGLQYVNNSNIVLSGDFDGDKKAELMVQYGSSWEHFELKKPGTIYQDDKIFNSTSFPYAVAYPGDFNGDGKTDVLSTNNFFDWTIGYSTGTGYSLSPFTFSTPYWYDIMDPEPYELKVMDFNGDGKSDILHVRNVTALVYPNDVTTKIDLYLSNGKKFKYFTQNVSPQITPNYFYFVYGDYNGDGKIEVFQPLYPKYIYFNKNGKDHLLNKVKNGFGQVVEASYDWLSKGSNYVRGGTLTAWPVIDIQPAIPVVKSLSSPNGIGGTKTVEYTYSGAKLHRQGKGFLGFLTTSISDYTSDMKVSREFEYKLTPRLILLKKEKTSLISTGASVSEITYTNDVTMTGLRYKIEVSAVNENNLLTTVVKTKSMTYDSYGNLLQLTANDGVEIVTTTSTYVAFGTWWIPSKLATITVSKTRSGQAAFSEKKNCFYNAFGSMYQEVRFPGTSTALTKTFGFDNFGNTISENTSSSGLISIVRTAEFDDKGRFMIKNFNPLNQVTEVVYDKKWGLPLSTKTPDGLVVTNTYNSFGSVLTNTSQTGIITTIQKQWSISSGSATPNTPQNTLYSIKTETQDKPYNIIWYDVLGREVQVDNEGQTSVYRIVTNYDSKGNVYTKTNPFVAGGSPVYTTYLYDVYGRMTSKSNGASNVTYGYSSTGGQTTVVETSPTGVITRVIDASNKLISNSDNSGTLSYTYYSSDKMKQVSMGGTILNSFEYDQYGNRTKLIDVDAGTNLSVFNAFGQLTSTTNANGEQFQMVYDVMGRETVRTGPNGVKTTTYVTSGNGLNMPLKITDPNGTYVENTYDLYGRTLSINEVVDGVSYLTSTAYDATKDRAVSMTYPSGYKIRFYYDANGFVSSVKNDAGSITMFSAPETNVYGEYTKYILGDGNTVQKSYNSYGNLTNIFVPGVQNLETSFSNSTGNLLYRKDYTKNLIEEFQYDGMQRLTQSKVSMTSNGLVTGIIDVTYSPNGNISSKSDVGNYQYDVNKIHAVTTVDNSNGSIPSLQQDITYTPLGMVSGISEGNNNLSITYGPDNLRVKSVLSTSGTTVKTKYFIGGLYEKEVTAAGTKEIHYIPTGDNTNAVYIIEGGVGSYYYLYRDHLESVVAVTKSSGVVIYEQNFDAWGNRRNPSNWTPASANTSYAWVRGFTGHEHLDEFGIINMNNRMYDPILGRMMEADNLIQDPYFTQSFNRFSYVVNNPLRYTDPTGDFWFVPVIAGAIVGATIGGLIADANGEKWWKGSIIGGIVGAGLGAVGAYAGAAVAPTGIAWTMTVNGLASANLAMLSNVAQGKNIDKIYSAGLLGLGAGALGSGLTGPLQSAGLAYAISGGLYGGFDRLIDSDIKGYNNETKFKNFTIGFVEGAATGALAGGKFIGPVDGAVSGTLFMQTTLTTIGITSVPGASISIASWISLGLVGSPKMFENYGASSNNDFVRGIPFSGYKALHPVWKYLKKQIIRPLFTGGNISEIQMFPTSYNWKEEYNYYK